MKRGRTIVAEREHLESASERMQARQKIKRKKILSVITVVLIFVILGILAVMGWQILFSEKIEKPAVEEEIMEPTAEIVDEAGRGVSTRTKGYIVMLETDFSERGYKVVRVDLPQDKSRELLVALDGRKGYIKVNIDRGTGVSVEDADRMIRYLDGQNIKFEYIDVRVEGKAFYK